MVIFDWHVLPKYHYLSNYKAKEIIIIDEYFFSICLNDYATA